VKGSSGLCSSAWCLAQLACVFHRQVREGFLDPEAAERQRSLFLADLDDGIWELFPLTDSVLRKVGDLTRSLPTSCFLRAGDAVHLVTALENGFSEIWTNDRHLKAAAVHAGITSLSVVTAQ
jgi:predicted nucleic acid-binding protein